MGLWDEQMSSSPKPAELGEELGQILTAALA